MNARKQCGITEGKASAVAVIDVPLCWGELVRDREFWRWLSLVLIKQTLTARVSRAVSSEIFEPCLRPAGPQQQPSDSW